MIRRSLKYYLSISSALLLLSLANSAFADDAGNNLPPDPSVAPVAQAAPVADAAPAPTDSQSSDSQSSEDQDSDDSKPDEPTIEQIEEAAQPPKLESNVFDTGQIVRRKLLYRSTRFELAPFVAVALNSPFNRAVMPGINLSYHLTNDLGISASFAYGAFQWKTSLLTNLVDASQKAGGAAISSAAFTKIQFFADLGLSYVPFYGKFILFNSATVHWDLHLVGGVGIINQKASEYKTKGVSKKLQEGDVKNSVLSGIKPGGLITAGVRLYLNDWLSLNLDVRNFIYSTSDFTVNNTANSEISDRVFFSFGLGFFLPTDIKVSW